jgi:hypothetical protein
MALQKAQFDNEAIAAAISEAIACGAEIVKLKANKIPKGTYYPNMCAIQQKIRRKSFKSGTSGFSMSYPKNDLLSKFHQHKNIGHY